jgi:uncharacterized protein YceK
MKKRNFITILLVLLTTVSLEGCGSIKTVRTQQTGKTSNNTKDNVNSNPVDTTKDKKVTQSQTAHYDQKQDDKTETNTKTTTVGTNDSSIKGISQDQGVRILKQGYVSGGVDIVFAGKTSLDGHNLLTYNIIYIDKDGVSKIGSVDYVDIRTKKVYYINDSKKLVECVLSN